jgi:hypothetical protein
MLLDADPVRACAQAIPLFIRTVRSWVRAPLRRGAGVAVTIGAALGALAIFALRSWWRLMWDKTRNPATYSL